jgi:hypothetical protein
MSIKNYLKRPPWRTLILLFFAFTLCVLSYEIWSPGHQVLDGRHDLRKNGIWIQHGWLGDNEWYEHTGRDKTLFRNEQKIKKLADLLYQHGTKYVFPHLCPCKHNGHIAAVDHQQTERFLDHFSNFSILPWIGGVLGNHCHPSSSRWRNNFVMSTTRLLEAHPRLAGIHINIEPLQTGNKNFLLLLDELRLAIPQDKIISLAAYPPPTILHPFPEVHWEETYFREVARRVDQITPMMYDTAIKLPKFYQNLMRQWTHEVLKWSGDTEVLLGIPAYDDAEVGYHIPEVENLPNALLGIHAALSTYSTLPNNYSGIAIYCEWEMERHEWEYLRKAFIREP